VVKTMKTLAIAYSPPDMDRTRFSELIRDHHQPLLAYARARGSTVYHAISTCRMGTDRNAVVGSAIARGGVSVSSPGNSIMVISGGPDDWLPPPRRCCAPGFTWTSRRGFNA